MNTDTETNPGTFERFVLEPLQGAWDQVVDHLPAIGTALIVLIALWVAAWIIRRVVLRILEATPIDGALEQTRISAILSSFKKGLKPSEAIARLAHLATMLLAWTAAADIVGLTVVRQTLNGMLAYVPQLTSALLVVILGGYLAGAARRAVVAVLGEIRSTYARLLESGVEMILLVIVVTIALDVLGVDVSIVTQNLTVILGAVALLLVFLFGWSMRRPAEEIIANYYLRRLIRVGDTVEVNMAEGVVESFSALGVVLQTNSGKKRFVPARHVLGGITRTDATPASVASLKPSSRD